MREHWVIKVPSLKYRNLLRGWLANRSEWKQRKRYDVNPVRFTLFHLASWYRRADFTPDDELWDRLRGTLPYDNEESKSSSWGYFNGRWLLLDYDRAWQPPRGIIGGLYYGNQERLGRKWMKLN